MLDSPKVRAARSVAGEYPEDLGHMEQVARLADLLFEALRPLHGLHHPERELLACAALLHDIGLSVSVSGHHKHSLALIEGSPLPALSEEERLVVANIARYHRKALPSARHERFRALPPEAQEVVRRLAAILRIADGFDRAHEDAVSRIDVAGPASGALTLAIAGPGDLAFAQWGAERKADLFEQVYGLQLRIEPRRP